MVKFQIHDMNAFTKAVEDEIPEGKVYLSAGALWMKFKPQHHAMRQVCLSGEHAFLIDEFDPGFQECPVLRDGFEVRVEPLGEVDMTGGDGNLRSAAVFSQHGAVIAVARAGGQSMARLGVLLGGGTTPIEIQQPFISRAWRATWSDKIGKPVLSITCE